MNNQLFTNSSMHIQGIIPPHILEAIAKNGNETQREIALRTLQQDRQIRLQRVNSFQAKNGKPKIAESAGKSRNIYDTNNTTELPGKLVRSEGQAATNDLEVDEAYTGFGATFDLYSEVYKRNSIDNNGMGMTATVHYDYHYNNAFWDGKQMVFGDGDGTIFNRFTIAIDIMGHELTHGVTEYTAGLEYHDQSGALNESISDVFGSLVKQRSLNQTADKADWLIGAGLLAPGIKGVALRSMKAPGTAYDDWLLGKDPQPAHMSKYVETTDDNGGVHINSGIPNKAFYLAALTIGGKAWEVTGNIWYQTLLDPRLSPNAEFLDFANLTVENAGRLYDDSIKTAIVKAWQGVGINVKATDGPAAKQLVVAQNKDGRLEVFCIGMDDGVYHIAQTAPGGDWDAWKPLGGKVVKGTRKERSITQSNGKKMSMS